MNTMPVRLALPSGPSEFGQPDSTPGLLGRLWRRRVTFLLVFLTIAGACAGTLRRLPTSYLASGSVIVAQQEPFGSETSAAWVEKLGDPADLESQMLLIRSPRLLHFITGNAAVVEAVRRECDVAQAQPKARLMRRLFRRQQSCKAMLHNPELLENWMTQRFSAGIVGRSRVISVSYESPLPRTAQILTNALIEAYLGEQRQQSLETRAAAVAWLRSEIARVAAGLHKSDLAIQEFRRKHGLYRGELSSLSAERLTNIDRLLANAVAAQASASARLQELGGAAGGGIYDAPAVLGSRMVGDLKVQLAGIDAQLAAASRTLAPDHPTLIALRQQRAESANVLASLHRDYIAASAQVSELTRELHAMEQANGNASDAEAEVASMVRNVEINRELYVDLVKKANLMESERRVETGNVQLVSYADLPLTPWFPKRAPFAAAGLVLATGLAGLAALLRDRADSSVRSTQGLEQLTGVRVLGALPWTRGRRSGGSPFHQLQHPSELQESVRSLFAQMILTGGERALRTFLVTSADVGEGKTFLTLALAQFAAATGRRVLAIECDLRRPQFRNVLALTKQRGLSDYLAGDATISDVICMTRQPGLDVVPAGRSSIASTELLGSARMAALLHHARGYDLVLLDTPPSQLLMDARILSRHVDGTLFCVRWGEADMWDVADSVDKLQAAGGRVVGLAVTMQRSPDPRPSYGIRRRSRHPYLPSA